MRESIFIATTMKSNILSVKWMKTERKSEDEQALHSP
jgi:hypothetical protein